MANPVRRTTTLQRLDTQGADTVVSGAFEIVQMGRFEDVSFTSVADVTGAVSPSLTVTVEDSQDGATWGTLVALTAQTADGVEQGVITRPPLRFIRISSLIAAGGDTWDADIEVTGDIGLTS